MKKELYVTPETEAVEIRTSDVITTSPLIEVSDELKGIDSSFFGSEDDISKLF